MSDFRSDRMPTAEGRGFARQYWDKYVAAVGVPLQPLAKSIATSAVCDAVGFWTLWHMYGGFEGLEEMGMARTTIFRRVRIFRRIFGAHPDEWRFDGINIKPGVVSGGPRQPGDTP